MGTELWVHHGIGLRRAAGRHGRWEALDIARSIFGPTRT
jgi:hypothetical protein